MGISNLPKPGIKFRATTGAGNFQRKLSNATRYGGLKNLRDNQKAIVDVVKKYQGVIRIKGGLSRLQKRDAWLKIKKSTPKLTYADKYEVKGILKHLGRGNTDAKKPAVGGKSFKVGGVEKYLTAEQVKRNLTGNKQRDELTTGVKRYKTFAGNVVSTKSSGTSDINKEIGAGRIGINIGPVGFIGGQSSQSKKDQAVNFNANNKLPDSSVLKSAPGGVKPIIKLAA